MTTEEPINEHSTLEGPPNPELPDKKMQSKGSPRVSPKKRLSRRQQLIKHRLLKHQGSSSLEPVHREYKNYGHIKRMNFAIFLKILMQQLSLTDKELHTQAQEVRLNIVYRIVHVTKIPFIYSSSLFNALHSIHLNHKQTYRWSENASRVNEKANSKVHLSCLH